MSNLQLPTLQKIGETSKTGVLVVDLKNGRIEYINDTLKRILEITDPGRMIHYDDLWKITFEKDVDYIKSHLTDLKKDGSVCDIEFNVTAGNHPIYVSVDATYIADEDKIVAFVRNITKAKEHAQYIITYGAKKDSLLEMLSHHLSGPLLLSKEVIHLLEKKFQDGNSEEAGKLIGFMKDTTHNCLDFIYDFLKEEHLVSETIYVKKNRFDAVLNVMSVIDQFNHSYPRRQLRYKSGPKQLFINGDDVKYFQIMNNLLSNAVKFTHEYGSIDISIDEMAHVIIVTIADNGIGIPENLKPMVFQKYTPAGRTGLNGERSIGLGLSIVKSLAELMSGSIEFTSTENKGTAFKLTLPKE